MTTGGPDDPTQLCLLGRDRAERRGTNRNGGGAVQSGTKWTKTERDGSARSRRSGPGEGGAWDESGTEREQDGYGTSKGRERGGKGTGTGRLGDGSGTRTGRERDRSGTRTGRDCQLGRDKTGRQVSYPGPPPFVAELGHQRDSHEQSRDVINCRRRLALSAATAEIAAAVACELVMNGELGMRRWSLVTTEIAVRFPVS